MNRFYVASLCLLLATACNGSASEAPGPDGKAAEHDVSFVYGGTLIVGDGTQVEKATMIVENGVVTQVGKEKELFAPKGSLEINAEGRVVMPMLVNLNAYPGLSNAQNFGASVYKRESLLADLSRYAYYGVSAVVAGGDSDGLAFQVRDEQRAGTVPGAQLHSSGRGIAARTGSGVLGSIPLLIGSADDGRKAVGELADRKADTIVLWTRGMSAAAVGAVIDEAHKRNLKVFAEATELAQAKEAAKAGADALISSITDHDVDDELVGLLKAKNISVAGSLSSLEARFIYADEPRWLNDSAIKEVYKSGLSAYLSDPVTVNRFKRNPQLAAYRQQFATASRNLKKLADSGVTIAFGTGSGLPETLPGYFEHHELELMVAAGLTPTDAIKAATGTAAAVLGQTDSGILAAGKKAHFMILGGDPLEAIKNTKLVDEVYFNGKKVDRAGLISEIVIEAPRVTDSQRREEAAIQQKEREEAEDRGQTRYGKYVLGPSVTLARGLIIQTPKRSQNSKTAGPPYKLTVTYAGQSGEDLRGFYAAVFARTQWTAASGCWEKANPGEPGKKFRACAEPAAGRIVLNVTVQ
jgi:imidazolonepropionase-like amidohydrolase